jgi:hypothetical protein
MKQLLQLGVLAILLSMLLPSNRLNACLPGWNEHTVTYCYTYNYNGESKYCYLEITYCCGWDNSLKTVDLNIVKIKSTGSGSDCNNWVHDKQALLYWAIMNCAYHLDDDCFPEWPPCDENWFYVKISNSICYRIANHPNEELLLRTEFILCNDLTDCKCYYWFQKCIDYSVNPPELKTIFTAQHRTENCQINCFQENPFLPPQGYTWDDEWYTNCYFNDCPNY